MDKQKKELSKEFIEDTLKDYISANLKSEDPLYNFWTSTRRASHGRAQYELIKRFENGQDICKDYDFGKNESERGGIPLSLVKISRDIWIPQQYIKYMDNLKKKKDIDPIFKSFEAFDQDDYNVFVSDDAEENLNLVRRILYGKDGKKLNLFLENPAWRKDAKEYSTLLLNTLKSTYKNWNNFEQFAYIDPTFERTKKGLKAIDLITSLYLDEMK